MAAEEGGDPSHEAVFVDLQRGAGARRACCRDTAPGWRLILDTTRPEAGRQTRKGSGCRCPRNSVLVFRVNRPHPREAKP